MALPELIVALVLLRSRGPALRRRALLQLRQSVAIRSAVHETTVAFFHARSYAISRGRNVGLKFRKNGDR